ncbi:dTDP-4-dehydrorhamnose reductase [candidate division KSB1 bacterium]|nr:dTDP-4-dehydrorhamnose reductase [candidate division KSB1 bacterium]
MEKIIITGCNGLLGQKLIQRFQKEFEVYGCDLHDEKYLTGLDFTYQPVDITQRRDITRFITQIKPAFVINSAAFTDVDGAETQRELCWKVNVEAVENIVTGCRKAQAHLVHVSTDYVFDGTDGPYHEQDVPNPQGHYAKSKLAGENIIVGSPIKWAIIRTMVLFGYGENLRPNFVTWLISSLRAGKQVTIVDDQIGNATLADDLAEGIYQVVARKKSGIFHISGAEILSRYQLCLAIADAYQLDKNLITPIKTADLKQKAPRPLKSGFILDKARTELELKLPKIQEMLTTFKRQYE